MQIFDVKVKECRYSTACRTCILNIFIQKIETLAWPGFH